MKLITNLFCTLAVLLCFHSWELEALLFRALKSNMQQYLNEILRFGGNNLPKLDARQFTAITHIHTKYDFIIVGAGPAGCVLANRLTERSDWKVLLIEAGEPENIFHRIPMLAAFLQGTPSNWNYMSEPQPGSCLGMNGNRCALPRGKALGGTSTINYMIYNRGNRRDFDRWAEAGNIGWSYREVLPYFLKSERANLKGKENSKYHSRKGLLSVEDVPYRSNLLHTYIRASKEAGLKEVDYNGESQIGVSYVQATTLKGHRHSAATSYIDPIMHRSNLHIMLSTRATKVLIDKETKTAYGIEFVHNRHTYKVHADKEVILSAGSFNSPQLLMLSGIGPQNHLNKLGIPVLKNLPVGRIMYDHLSHFGPTFIVNSTDSSLQIDTLTLSDIRNFAAGQGRLTSIGGVESLAFVKTANSKEPSDFPDAEIIFVSGSLASDEGTGLKEGGNIRDDLYNKVYRPLEKIGRDHYSTLIMQFHPKSVGYIELQDANPFHWPKIYPNYLKDEDDVETLLNGIKAAIKISQSPAMKKLGVLLYDETLPGCEHLNFASDDYWRCSIRTLSYTLHHQVATCKMGPESDPTSIVDPELKVHGIQQLRVVDTSIIPQPPTAHTNAASFMIGEKASDMIKSKWS